MKNGDVTEGSCFPDHVCYRSEWDIGSSMSAYNNVEAKQCPDNDRVFCIKPGNDDICTDLTTTFTSGNCVKSTFSFTKSITVDFLNPSEIKQEIPNGLPAKINATLPPNCENLTVDYTCLEKSNPSESRSLWELEPFTDYTCTGQIKHNNVIVKNTTTIEFDIDCDLTTEITEERVTNTSFVFSWTTTSQRCKNVTKDPKFSYVCSCYNSTHKPRSGLVRGGTCSVDGLKPFTNYICEVQPTYNNKKVVQAASVKKETDVGIPEEITAVKTFVHDHNAINVTCREIKRFNGPKELYIARLFLNGAEVSKQEKVRPCKFEFKDLSYSTTYRVQVNAYNGRFEGIGKSDHKDTLCMSSFKLLQHVHLLLNILLRQLCGSLRERPSIWGKITHYVIYFNPCTRNMAN
uniref:receptor-type tyrosine-protein phosphatase C-like n=1 Tax=Semicossyphus pulcher TaxID=241346 RepID=UPI0037E863D7